MKAVQDFTAEALRDDEWVFSGQSFTDKLWMDKSGKLQFEDVPTEHQIRFGVSDSIIEIQRIRSLQCSSIIQQPDCRSFAITVAADVLSLARSCLESLSAAGEERPGRCRAETKERISFNPVRSRRNRTCGGKSAESLMQPLMVKASQSQIDTESINTRSKLARPGESGDAAIPKQSSGMHSVIPRMVNSYKADINVVDLGLVYDVRFGAKW